MTHKILILSMLTSSVLIASNIEIYGVAHLSADSVNNQQVSTLKVASNSSRLGFKADHDLDNEVKVFAKLESGIDLTGQGYDDGNGGLAATSNTGTFFTRTRESYLGVSTKYGTVKMGVLSVIDRWMYDYNLFADQVGDLGNTWGHSSTFINRANDMISYALPPLVDGLKADVSYLSDLSSTFGKTQGDEKNITGILFKVDYEIYGFKAGIGYLNISNEYTDFDPSDLAFTTSYTADNFSVGAGYVYSKNTDDGYQIPVTIEKSHSSYMLGGSYSIKDFKLKSQYSIVSDSITDSDAQMIAIGLDYKLAEKTTAYLAYAATTNDAKADYKANNYGHGKSAYGAPAVGDDPSAFSIGLIYSFGGTIYKD